MPDPGKIKGSEKVGSRKVVLTKWMLVIFSFGTLGYYILLAMKKEAPPETFFMNFVFGLGAIGGAFTVGNIFEHRANADKVKSVENAQAVDNKAKAEVDKVKAEAEVESIKAKAVDNKAKAEVDKVKAEAEVESIKAKAELEKIKAKVDAIKAKAEVD